ncbi:SDR family NAD(P)-dependent oxidoreductase, partial [Streptomyces anulatus]|uniref:SDR family NAD(P)-dependent oxidoreductase n=1 Tax=Streptomyces anulatus TaxID=1892 RepID=UPI00365AE2F9
RRILVATELSDTGLAQQIVLVTGGSTGIGRAISRAFATEGARVAVHYYVPEQASPPGKRREHATPAAEAADLARELGDAITVAADLSEPDAADRLFDDVEARLGPVDVLVNNAAHCESPDTVDALTAAGLERHYRVNVTAPALLTAALAHRARDGRSPCVVNISTDAARAFPGQIGYGTSKAALEAFTRAAALDLGRSGIRVNAVAPGPVQTGWMDTALIDRVREAIPMGRVGEPEDIADAVVFLASHQARWITGQVLQVAGGHAL